MVLAADSLQFALICAAVFLWGCAGIVPWGGSGWSGCLAWDGQSSYFGCIHCFDFVAFGFAIYHPLELIMLKGKRRQNKQAPRRRGHRKLFGWQRLEDRQMLAADTELLVTHGDIYDGPVVDLTSPTGEILETLVINGVHRFDDTGPESWSDSVVDANGDLWILTRSASPRLFQVTRSDGLESAEFVQRHVFSGFTMNAFTTVPTDLAIYGRSLFILDNLDPLEYAPGAHTAEPGTAGIVQYDIETGTTQHFSQGKDYTSLCVGLDGLLYAAGKEQVVEGVLIDNVGYLDVTFEVDVYDPETLELIETRTPRLYNEFYQIPYWVQSRVTSFTVDHDGTIVMGFDGSGLLRFDANDFSDGSDFSDPAQYFPLNDVEGVTKINLNADGDLVYSTRNPNMLYRGTTDFSVPFSRVGVRPVGPPAVTFNHPAIYADNAKPQAVDDVFSVAEQYGDLLDVLANDTDPDNDLLEVLSATQPLNGTVTVNEDGTIMYVPTAGYLGSDSFEYTIADERGARSTATINLMVETATAEVSDLIAAVETMPDSVYKYRLSRRVSVIEQRLEAGQARYAVVSLMVFQRQLRNYVTKGKYTQADIQEAYDIAGAIREDVVEDNPSLAEWNDLFVNHFNL